MIELRTYSLSGFALLDSLWLGVKKRRVSQLAGFILSFSVANSFSQKSFCLTSTFWDGKISGVERMGRVGIWRKGHGGIAERFIHRVFPSNVL